MTPTASGVNKIFSLPHLVLWRDPVARCGEDAMATDELILNHEHGPVLRIYRWKDPTVTYGYFDQESVARTLFPDEELHFVRRWTGGGIVDHRADTPFTLALHWNAESAERSTSSLLYKWIHGALAEVLRELKIPCLLLSDDAPDGGRACFSSPVTSDLTAPNGVKLAGGGQRRIRDGVLHQGSIQNCCLPDGWDELLASRLADTFTVCEESELFPGMQQQVEALSASKYSSEEWRLGSRHRSPFSLSE